MNADVDWTALSHLQVGRYAGYLAMMQFTAYGFQVYRSEVDDRGIDFVVRKESGPFFEVQVKSLRNTGYSYIPKEKMRLAPERWVVFVLVVENAAPALYLIPSLAWREVTPLLATRDYADGQKSKPEWGIQISTKNQPLLEKFAFAKQLEELERGTVAWSTSSLLEADVLPRLEAQFHAVIRSRAARELAMSQVLLPNLQYCPTSETAAAWFPVPGM